MKIVILVNSKEDKNTESNKNHVQANDVRCETVKNVNREVKPCKLKTFCEEEVNDPSISRLEKEKICFWNDLSCKIDCHPVYKDWSLQARNGIVDTEWTLRKTELLKLEADVVIKRLNDKQIEKGMDRQRTSGSGKKVRENLDRLLQAEFHRKTTYKKIEDLHNNLKSFSTDRHKNEEKIANEEDNLDRIFTELKSSQSALEMAITRSHVCREDDADLCNLNFSKPANSVDFNVAYE